MPLSPNCTQVGSTRSRACCPMYRQSSALVAALPMHVFEKLPASIAASSAAGFEQLCGSGWACQWLQILPGHAQRQGADPRSTPVDLPSICRGPAGRHADKLRVQSQKEAVCRLLDVQCSIQSFQADVTGKDDHKQAANNHCVTLVTTHKPMQHRFSNGGLHLPTLQHSQAC